MVTSQQLTAWAQACGFAKVRVSQPDVSIASQRFQTWLAQGFAGEMAFLHRYHEVRQNPALLQPSMLRVISVTMNYMPQVTETDMTPSAQPAIAQAWHTLHQPAQAYVSRYALGRDYHKVLRQRLKRLAEMIREHTGTHEYRVCTDSAPLMEVEIATQAGLGWRGKHTLLLNREAGSLFFLGEILTDLPLEIDPPVTSHCGACQACITVCPTQAIIAPYQLDARRCIAYLTIEYDGDIPHELRPLIGNRIYGCDDCQLVCPWNKFAQVAVTEEFAIRHNLDAVSLASLAYWTADQFNQRMEGSAIRRIGFGRWQRNVAVGLTNAVTNTLTNTATRQSQDHPHPAALDDIQRAIAHLRQVGEPQTLRHLPE
jgi:epoxyqueuosine reductase